MATMLSGNHPSSYTRPPAGPSPQPFHRKPLPQTSRNAPVPSQYANSPADFSSYSNLSAPVQTSHSRSRTSSSSVFPPMSNSPGSGYPSQQYPPQQQYSQYPPQQYSTPPSHSNTMVSSIGGIGTRRTLSNATSSTSSTTRSNPNNPTTSSAGLRRSSSTSTQSPTSYVALMRKQKATVWCDRSQTEDPRMLAAQRAAKARALTEIAGGPAFTSQGSTRSSSSGGGVAAGVRKIRHGGAHKAIVYAPPTGMGMGGGAANMVGQGVPMRLIATEVDEEDSEEGDAGRTGTMGTQGGFHHQRSGSGRSSLGSGKRVSYAMGTSTGLSSGSSPGPGTGLGSTPSRLGSTPPQTQSPPQSTYATASAPTLQLHNPSSDSRTYTQHSNTRSSSSSTSSQERERGFGDLSVMNAPRVSETKREGTSKDDLVRRGSVDERTMTMGGRLYIANPDLD